MAEKLGIGLSYLVKQQTPRMTLLLHLTDAASVESLPSSSPSDHHTFRQGRAEYIERWGKQVKAKHLIFTSTAFEAITLRSQMIGTLATICLLYSYQLKH
ncbi:hypothetical protein [Aeribacillus pallidus]|nr:hypothetical protein [Aeribacillus pallidus]